MDIYGAASTALVQAIQVTVFIKGVICSIKSYEDDRTNIELKLDLQLTSLEFFRRRFLDQENGLLLPGRLPEWVADAICRLLLHMVKTLSEYRAIVAEYDVFDASRVAVNDATRESERAKQSLTERAEAKIRTLKLKGYNWSLFDKRKILQVLADYKEWADSLRDLMQHFSQEQIYTLSDAISEAKDLKLKGTGLEPVVKRQKLVASQVPDDFQGLEGSIIEEGTSSDRFQLARWTHEGKSDTVVIEYHEYDRRLKYEDVDPSDILELKAPLRDLAWLLQNSAFNHGYEEGTVPSAQQPIIYSLQCLGFMDEPRKERITFLYKLPSALVDVSQGLLTLHELINGVDGVTNRPLKPSLGERFRIAHCLALTLANVHGSNWVHKNLWSRGILLFQQSEEGLLPLAQKNSFPPSSSRRHPILAFLGDWGYARPLSGATEMRSDFAIEPNLYRHPDRQGLPTRQFSRTHDIYALGVVLLEIGVWKTVSQLFGPRVKDSQWIGRPPRPRDIKDALVNLALKEVGKEMGEGYAAAVATCLETRLRTSSDLELSFDFKAKVIDAIIPGIKL